MAKTNFHTVDEYVATFPKTVQALLEQARETIRRVVPEAEETISYQIPTFKLNGKYLVYLAAFKNHISIYPFSSAMGQSMKEASAYRTSGKGTIQFPLDKPLPLRLIQKIVKYRMKERLQGARNKPKKR